MKAKIPEWLKTMLSIILLALIFVAYFVSHEPKIFVHPLTIGNTQLHVAIADTDAARRQGLSGTAPLEDGEGMLFVFPAPDNYPFWMKDMRYPLDIVWAGADKTVVHIEPDLAPATYPNEFSSPVPAQYVLEVPAGFAQKNGITIGTPLSF